MQMDVIFADHSLQNLDIQGVAGLPQQVPTTELDIPYQHLIAVFGTPDQVHLQVVDRVTTCALLHGLKLANSRSE